MRFAVPFPRLVPREQNSPRARRLVSVLLLVVGVCVLTSATQFAGGAFMLGALVLLVGGIAALCLGALSRGFDSRPVAMVLLVLGIGLAAALGVLAGHDGLPSVFWIALTPLVGISIGGRDVGRWTLVVAMIAIPLALLAIEFQWLMPQESPYAHALTPRVLTVLGACLMVYVVARIYDVETERGFTSLRQQNQALLEARLEAERANKAKSEFLATISHEIRTPLNGLLGMTAALRGERSPERLDEGLRIVQLSADTLLAVINDVLDFSKIEAGGLELETVSLSLPQQLASVVELMRARAQERGNELDLDVDPSFPEWISGDPTRLRQVALNLVSNAVKFTEAGRVRCHLGVHDKRVVLEVSDTGVGMTPETLARIGAPFVQADTSTTRKYGGSGLGLAIVRRLVHAMGGQLAITSAPGKGTRITIELPLVVALPPRSSPSQKLGQVGPLQVLLVEDNLVNRTVATRLLEKFGHTVAVAGNGREALQFLESRSFDVVLMDCHMPEMDGFDATRALRLRDTATPVFALTAGVSVEEQRKCIDAGMNLVLAKPLNVGHLQRALASVRTRPADVA